MVGRTMARLGGQQPSGGTMDGLEREGKPNRRAYPQGFVTLRPGQRYSGKLLRRRSIADRAEAVVPHVSIWKTGNRKDT